MPKVEINQVAEILKRNKADAALLRAVVEEMNLLARAAAEDEKPPAVKKQFIVLVSDPDGRLPKGVDFAGWVVQIPEEDSPVTTLDRIHRGAYEFNASKKGRLLPVRTVGEALENVPAKHFQEAGVSVRTKTPVLVVKTNNLIPRATAHCSSEAQRAKEN